jgi:predicted AAA+ superfamily ATPase
LLGVNQQEQLNQHPIRGAIFENFMITELLKQRYNRGLSNNLYFWRDNSGHEIDLLLEEVTQLHPIEIKSGKTITNDYFKSLIFWQKLTGKNEGTVLYAGDQVQKRSDGLQVLPWRSLVGMVGGLEVRV